jgi:hypothetical protein
MPEPRGNADTQLRDHLVALYVDLRELFSRTLPDDRTASGQPVWELWSPIVDALLAGEPVVVAIRTARLARRESEVRRQSERSVRARQRRHLAPV